MKKIVLLLLLFCGVTYAQDKTASTSDLNTVEGKAPLKIGEEFATNTATAHPYNPSGTKGVVFEQEFYNKNSAYIKIYFDNFDLAPGDYVEITAVNTGESIVYAGQGKIIDKNMTMISNFWSQVLFDDRVVVRLHAKNVTNYYGFDIPKVAYGYPQSQIDQLLGLKSICGQDDKEPIVCYNGTSMYTQGRAVCRLIIGGTGSCTGWLLGCDGHVMTNNHCVGSTSDANNTDFVFNYEHTNCNGTGNATQNVVATSSTLIKTNSGLDYTLVQLPVNPTPTYGYLSLSSVAPIVSDRIYIVGHPGGRRKEITVVTDQGGDINGNAIVNQVTATGIRYYADTEGGSSGSPVFNHASNLVVAIHNTGGCTNGSSGRSDQLIAHLGTDMPNCGIDSSGTVPTPCGSTVTLFPYTESFENTFGAWSQSTTDDFDWITNTGTTPSTGTGPTAASNGSYYAYMEASSPNNPSKVAVLNSPCFNMNGVIYPELIFNYHMYGANMGTLNVDVSTNGATWTTLWTKSGDQGTAWITDTVDLSAYTSANNLRIRFHGTTGASYDSDIAIDAVQLSQGTPNCSLVNTFPYNESFENTLGGWMQESNDDMDWTVNNGGTPSNGTGPTAANDGSYYIYTEASNPNNPNKTAFLTSPCFDMISVANPEMSFMYHMSGGGMGTLNLQASISGSPWQTIWTKSGDQGTAWLPATVDLSNYTNATDLRLRFSGVTGASFESDISVDAVSIYSASVSCGTTINTYPYTESFENTFGAWIQKTGDDFDWAINTGATPSNNTGPTAANDGSYYAYMEASTPNFPTRNAILISPCFDLSNVANPRLAFDYHMYGANMGNLTLEASANGSPWTAIWTKSGDQGTAWLADTIDLSVYSAYTNATDFVVRFNGTTGSDFTSDISIDAFSIFEPTITSIDNAAVAEGETFLQIAPNPFRDYIEVFTNRKDIEQYTILNIHGQIVKTGNMQRPTIHLGDLAQGVYFIRFANEKEQITKKIVKQ